jgi:hypothetical protein
MKGVAWMVVRLAIRLDPPADRPDQVIVVSCEGK